MSKFFCNGADAECSCPILCADCESADWTGGTEIKTNADHIRSITDEELAAEIALLHTTCEVCAKNETCCGMLGIAMCVEGVRDWLKQPYKEDT